jgi:hypothetical protein
MRRVTAGQPTVLHRERPSPPGAGRRSLPGHLTAFLPDRGLPPPKSDGTPGHLIHAQRPPDPKSPMPGGSLHRPHQNERDDGTSGKGALACPSQAHQDVAAEYKHLGPRRLSLIDFPPRFPSSRLVSRRIRQHPGELPAGDMRTRQSHPNPALTLSNPASES